MTGLKLHCPPDFVDRAYSVFFQPAFAELLTEQPSVAGILLPSHPSFGGAACALIGVRAPSLSGAPASLGFQLFGAGPGAVSVALPAPSPYPLPSPFALCVPTPNETWTRAGQRHNSLDCRAVRCRASRERGRGSSSPVLPLHARPHPQSRTTINARSSWVVFPRGVTGSGKVTDRRARASRGRCRAS